MHTAAAAAARWGSESGSPKQQPSLRPTREAERRRSDEAMQLGKGHCGAGQSDSSNEGAQDSRGHVNAVHALAACPGMIRRHSTVGYWAVHYFFKAPQ